MNVDAAERASAIDTDFGSLWKLDAVRRAACFCSIVVPSVGGGLADCPELLPSFAKRFCSSFIWPVLGGEKAPDRGGGAGLLLLERDGGSGGAGLPMPRAGTDTPADPSRLSAFWLRYPPPLDVGGGAGDAGAVATEVEDGVRGGSLGGRLGGGRVAVWPGVLPSAPSFRPGGGGR